MLLVKFSLRHKPKIRDEYTTIDTQRILPLTGIFKSLVSPSHPLSPNPKLSHIIPCPQVPFLFTFRVQTELTVRQLLAADNSQGPRVLTPKP